MFVEEKSNLIEEIDKLVTKYGRNRSALLPILHGIQKKYRYVSDFAQQEIAKRLNIHPVEVYSVITFYSFLNKEPKGRNLVRICKSVVCDMKGKDSIVKALERELGIKMGETTKDKKITLEYLNCLGLCDKSPAMAINDRVYTNLTPEKAVELINKIK